MLQDSDVLHDWVLRDGLHNDAAPATCPQARRAMRRAAV